MHANSFHGVDSRAWAKAPILHLGVHFLHRREPTSTPNEQTARAPNSSACHGCNSRKTSKPKLTRYRESRVEDAEKRRDRVLIVNKLGIYVQVPFCQTRCTYCNFHTGLVNAAKFAPYVNSVCEEILRHRELYAAAG